MTAVQPVLHHPVTGDLIPFGRQHRWLEEHFLETAALPAWMQSTGTYLWEAPNISAGFGRISTTAVTANRAEFAAARLWDIGQARATAITVEGFRASANTAPFDWGVSLSVTAGTLGVMLRHRAGEASAELVLCGATQTIIPIAYSMLNPDGNATAPRSLTLLYARLENLAVVLSGRQVVAVADTTGLVTNGDCRPAAYIVTGDATSRWIQLSKFRIETWA